MDKNVDNFSDILWFSMLIFCVFRRLRVPRMMKTSFQKRKFSFSRPTNPTSSWNDKNYEKRCGNASTLSNSRDHQRCLVSIMLCRRCVICRTSIAILRLWWASMLSWFCLISFIDIVEITCFLNCIKKIHTFIFYVHTVSRFFSTKWFIDILGRLWYWKWENSLRMAIKAKTIFHSFSFHVKLGLWRHLLYFSEKWSN